MTTLQPILCTYLLFLRRLWCKLIKTAFIFVFRAIRVPLDLDIIEIIKYGDPTRFLSICQCMELSSKIVELGIAIINRRASAARIRMIWRRVGQAKWNEIALVQATNAYRDQNSGAIHGKQQQTHGQLLQWSSGITCILTHTGHDHWGFRRLEGGFRADGG
ncbi:hypothetical protein FB446DRAFT_706632 [Lentinula raphanica]|nr:hypothetical protein FB446DRAFT_706632 [Lentinula raphanica]